MNRPNSWETVSIGEALGLINGRAFKPTEWTRAGAPIIRIQNLNDPDAAFNYYEGELPEKFRVQIGDLLFAWSGTPGTSFGAHIWRGNSAWLNQHIFRVTFSPKLFDKKFLQLAINQNLHEYVRAAHGGAGLAHITKGKFEASTLPVPPLHEQRRIVAKIEELFSELDKGIENLKQARAQLAVYRQSLLMHAFEGKLTATWRATHAHELESADQLLARIRAARRSRWEELELRKFKADGTEPPKDWKTKYREPVPHETVDSPSLTKGWAITSMDALTCRITSGSRDWQQYYDSGTGTFIMAQNVRPGRFDTSFRQQVDPPADDSSCERSRVEKDDLLVTIVGANTGNVCRVPGALEEHYVCQSVALMRPVLPRMGRFLEIYFNATSGGQFHYRRYIYGAGRPHLSFDQLKMTPVVLPPLLEQEAIIKAVDDQLSVIEHLESDIDTNLQKAEALRQSILKKAFAGELVPQDPNDEPASALLARIRAEREAAKPQSRQSSRIRKLSGRKADAISTSS